MLLLWYRLQLLRWYCLLRSLFFLEAHFNSLILPNRLRRLLCLKRFQRIFVSHFGNVFERFSDTLILCGGHPEVGLCFVCANPILLDRFGRNTGLQVRLVPQNAEGNFFSARGRVMETFLPLADRVVRELVGCVVYDYSAVCAPVELSAEALESLLARSVPYLQLHCDVLTSDPTALQHYLLTVKVRPNSIPRLLIEVVVY